MKIFRYFFLLCTLLTTRSAHSQISHAEPLNWWVGMKNQSLQLLLNGPGIGNTTPVIQYPGVKLVKVNKAGSPNYLFLDLQIAANTKPGNLPIRFLDNGKETARYAYPLLAREKNAASLKGFDASDVIYLITPDRFANGDSTNDIIPGMRENKIDRNADGGRHGGDIRGIINHLDYIKDMGFTAVWPTPVLENDMEHHSYHGYSITDHYKVDPRFGTLDEYKELSAQLRARGMKLIFDEVLNHTGLNYWWMNDLPFSDWINYPDTLIYSSHRRTVQEDAYASQYDKDRMIKGWFDKTMPDMNGANPFMARYLIQQSIWWIETLHLGGVRQDTYCYSDKNFLTQWSCSILNEYPQFSTVGEEWSLNPLITSYWQKGQQTRDGYKSCLTSTMCFPLQSALVKAINDTIPRAWDDDLTKLYEELANDFAYPDPQKTLVFADNHDMDRIYTQVGDNLARTKMALTYILTIRGIPEIYYGTEILMQNTGHHKVDGLIRSDFPGGWPGDKVNGFTGQGLTPEQADMQSYLRKLLNWRKTSAAITSGKTMHFAPYKGFYVYFRYTDKQLIMVVMNNNADGFMLDPKRYAEILKNNSSAVNVITGEHIWLKAPFAVPGKTVAVYEVNY